MSEAKYTPGHWKAMPEEVDKDYIRIRGTCLGGRYKVANVLTPTYNGVHKREAEETRANARLIAAAPELLEALQELADLVEAMRNGGYEPDSFTTQPAYTAIAKALGTK